MRHNRWGKEVWCFPSPNKRRELANAEPFIY